MAAALLLRHKPGIRGGFVQPVCSILSPRNNGYCLMTNLTEIEAAAGSLSPADKQQLLLFLAASLRNSRRQTPEPRLFVREQLAAWIDEDDADMRRFREGA
jgi:hypothetical protein